MLDLLLFLIPSDIQRPTLRHISAVECGSVFFLELGYNVLLPLLIVPDVQLIERGFVFGFWNSWHLYNILEVPLGNHFYLAGLLYHRLILALAPRFWLYLFLLLEVGAVDEIDAVDEANDPVDV